MPPPSSMPAPAAPLFRMAVLLAAAFLAPACLGAGGPNPNAPLDRPYSLRNPEPLLLEREYSRTVRGGALAYALPRPCLSDLDSSHACPAPRGVRFAGADDSRAVWFSPQAGLGYRHVGEHAGAAEGGILAAGHAGPVSFGLDARMYAELHEDAARAGWDREYQERQDASSSGTVGYTSFSRYRAHAAIDLSWGRVTAGKDAVHWGPGLYQNLSFSQDAIPFRNLAFSTSFGPFSVTSLYGRLAPHTDWETDLSGRTRSIYAHRYEWRLGKGWLAGISEQLVIHDAEAPFAFLPVVPLYIAKAEENEARNNGNLAADLTWRIRGRFRIYGEFFIDDMQSPTSLFDDSWGNKWACMAGLHAVWDGFLPGGAAAEWSRIEPWVYTHYEAHTAQTAHYGHPLGNQAGPNSQSVSAKAWLDGLGGASLSARADLLWKGTDHGSAIDDEFFSAPTARKEFLRGIGRPDISLTPAVTYLWHEWSASAWVRLGADPAGTVSLLFRR